MIGVGYAIDKNAVDTSAGDTVIALVRAFEQIEGFYALVQRGIGDGSLLAIGYTQEQVDFLNRAASDMHSLRQVAYGVQDQQGDYDFLDAPGELTGTTFI